MDVIHVLLPRNIYMGVSKNRGYPKMDGENNGKPYEKMDDLGGKPTIFENIHIDFFLPDFHGFCLSFEVSFGLTWLPHPFLRSTNVPVILPK